MDELQQSVHVTITTHAQQRFAERMKIVDIQEMNEVTKDVLQYGSNKFSFSGEARRFLESKCTWLIPLVHNGWIYLFDINDIDQYQIRLVTVYQAPPCFFKEVEVIPGRWWTRLIRLLRNVFCQFRTTYF